MPALGGETISPRCPAADGGYEVDEPGGELSALVLELYVFQRGDGREVLEVRSSARGIWIHVVHGIDANESEVSLAVLGWADLTETSSPLRSPNLRICDCET